MCDISPGNTGLLHYVGHADTLWDVKWAAPGQSDVSIYGRQHQVWWTLRTICQFQILGGGGQISINGPTCMVFIAIATRF